MPKRKRTGRRRQGSDDDDGDSDSEWDEEEQEEEEQDDEDDDVDYDKEDGEQEKPRQKNVSRSAATTAAAGKVSRAEVVQVDDDSSGEDEDDEEENMPTSMRKTARGGYAHTKASRAKISAANTGNTPWNKGKHRSSDAKSKISAGVKARNRAILLRKLEKLGMTENEWNAKKKQIKLARERLRRQRKFNRDQEELKKNSPAVAARERTSEAGDNGDNDEGQVDDKSVDDGKRPEKGDSADAVSARKSNENGGKDDEEDEDDEPAINAPVLSVLARDFRWTPHPYDSVATTAAAAAAQTEGTSASASGSPEASFASNCPNSGPGGLICCSTCTANYSQYLTATHRDLERHDTAKVRAEVTELMGFLRESKSTLESTLQAAKNE